MQTASLKLVESGFAAEPERPRWRLDELGGRLVEISVAGAGAPLTHAMGLVLEAQIQDEPAAWITTEKHAFFAPDAADSGVDLGALAVIRVPDGQAAGRAADKLLRSGAFGLLIVDLQAGCKLPTPLVARLAGLARKHHSALVFLCPAQAEGSALGSFTSLRARTHRTRQQELFACELQALKDRRHSPGWRHEALYRGPAGLI